MIPLLGLKQERLTEISVANIWKFVLALGCAMLLFRFFPPLAFALAALVVVAALRGQATIAFYALLLIPTLNFTNWVLCPQTIAFELAARLVFILLCFVLLLQASAVRERYHVLEPFGWLIGYAVVMLLLSPASYVPAVSAAKAVFFLFFIGTQLALVSVMLHKQIHPGPVRSAVLAIACFLILGSLLTVPFPAIGYSMVAQAAAMGNASLLDDTYGLFNGVTYHSQALGTVLAILNAFLLSDYLFNLRSGGKLHQVLLCCIPVLIFYSSCRTGMLAYLGSTLIVWFFLMRNRQVPARKRRTVQGIFLLGCLALALGLATSQSLRAGASNFLQKKTSKEEQYVADQGQSLSEILTASRLDIAKDELATFYAHPVFGIGFQVSEELRERSFTSFKDFFSTQIEKGVTPTMILEESGVVGATIIFVFLFTLYTTLLRRQCYCFLSTFSTFLMLNMGEATLFSPSAGGGMFWTLCFCALLLDLHRIRYNRTKSRPQEALGTQANWTFG